MKSVSIKFPDKMVDFIEEVSVDDMLNFKRAAFLLYAYIDAGKLSHGRAAELLGVDKFDLIDFYGEHGLEYVEVLTWTTDGFYRETPEKVAYRKEEGCAVVEMECSALAAVAQFRNVI